MEFCSGVDSLSRAQANQPRAGDMLGRLFMTGEINRDQHEAGVLYAQHRVDYDRAMLAQRLVTAGDPLDRGGYDARDGTDPDYRTFVRRVVARHARVRQALGACHDPLAGMVLDAVVLEEREMWNFVGTLRLALNAVGRVLR